MLLALTLRVNGDEQSSARGEYQSYTQPVAQFEIVRFVQPNSNAASSQKYGVLQFEPRGKTITARPIGSYSLLKLEPRLSC